MNVLLDTFNAYLPYLKGAGLLLTLLWGGLSLYFAIKTGWAIKQLEHVTDSFLGSMRFKKRTIKAWKEISQHINTEDKREWKLAIIEADILLGDTLHILGVPGKGTGEKLSNIDATVLTNLNDVWQAHRLRNQIAHEANIELTHDLAERSLAAYREALRQLGVVS